jgi:hypothetical protein
MARSTLATLIERVRGMTNAGTADYTIGTAAYWDADHVQDVLDRYRLDVYQEQLGMIEKWVGGTVQYLEYQSHYTNLEETSGGTAIFYLEDGAGSDIGTSLYSVDYQRGRVTFAADTSGTTYYLTARSYDLNAAAADIWRQKASYFSESAIDFSTDNHRVSNSQVIKNCMDMAARFESMSLPQVSTLYRSDNDAYALD